MPTFEAHTQYNDWAGTAAADDADGNSLSSYARKAGHIADDDIVVGIEVFVGENHAGKVKPAMVQLLTLKGDFERAQGTIKSSVDPVKVRAVEFDLPVEELMGLFKRFSLAVARKGLTIEEYEVEG